jgi:Na+/alanine symporter
MGFLLYNKLSDVIHQNDCRRIGNVMFVLLFEFGVVRNKTFRFLQFWQLEEETSQIFGEQMYNITDFK